MTTLYTNNLILSFPTEQDFQILSALWRNDKVRQYLGGILTEDAIEEKITFLQAHWEKYQFGVFTVIEKRTKEIIGLCGLLHSQEGFELVYMYFPPWWRKGLAFDAAKAVLKFGVNELKLERIIAITQEANEKSCKMLERLGMRLLRKEERFKNIQRVYVLQKDDISN
ncbi:MAG: hypothetical protein BGO43_15200 [Gammaproteobacteria bacterium 39-13]|nr:GNAT family N-acetyltransferase [Gammaproteobacteria bacterium]OJV87764.1 MAG: hypothetical protein BGO43_15200 [Gammaproteobacteria bacterium 39-13]